MQETETLNENQASRWRVRVGVQGRPSEQLTEYSETWGLQTLWDSERQALQRELGKLSTSQRAERPGQGRREHTQQRGDSSLLIRYSRCCA